MGISRGSSTFHLLVVTSLVFLVTRFEIQSRRALIREPVVDMDPRKVLKFKKGASTLKEEEEEEDTEMNAGAQPAGIDVVSL